MFYIYELCKTTKKPCLWEWEEGGGYCFQALKVVYWSVLTWAMGLLCVTWEGSTLVMVIPGGSLRLSMLKLFGNGCLDDKRLMALLICIAAGLVSLGAAWGWGGAGAGAGAGAGTGADLTFTSTLFFMLLVTVTTVGAVFWLLLVVSFFVLLFTLFTCTWTLFTIFTLALFGMFFDFPLPLWLVCCCAAGCGGCCFPFPAFLGSLPGSEHTEQRKQVTYR